MTTPPSPPLPPPPAYAPPGYAPVPGRRGPGRAALVALVVAALLAAGFGAWWWTRDGDDDLLAGRPWATDLKAGVSYRIPEGWERKDKGLIGAFTMTIRTADRDTGAGEGSGSGGDAGGEGSYGMVLSGRADPVPESALKARTESAARSNAVFFYPDGSSEVTESTATTVSGRPAHTTVLAVKDGEGGTAHLRLTLTAADANRSVFLLGVAKPGQGSEQPLTDAVLESAKLL
ncbi:hypothetical protein [Streptomyces sp. G45]|uniref:hypothetical protein n=1 Tax=Streptomyces sp. G45 TaxID=3406627 RepID=UPI003C286F54